jgi:hypothetical protein
VKRPNVVLLAFATLLATLLLTSAASALPRFAAREGMQCITCHVNPAGGGMRSRYGRYVYAPTAIPMFYPRGAAPLDVDVGDSLAFGADSRFTYLNVNPPQGAETISTFFQMQGNFYAGAQVYPGITLYYNQEIWGSFEAMGIWQQDFGRPDMSMYIKAGRFMPTYGLRIENHNIYTRQDIGFGPTDKTQGAELGVYLGPVLVQGSVLNSSVGPTQLDDTREKAFIGRAEVLPTIDRVHFLLGASIFANESGTVTTSNGTTVDGRVQQNKWGVHWGAGIGRFAYLGEADVVRNQPFAGNTQDARQYSYQSYQELDARIVRGLELNLTYEFRDPDLDMASGTTTRLGGGFEVYPVPYVELKALYRRTIGRGPLGSDSPAVAALNGLQEVILMAHLYF